MPLPLNRPQVAALVAVLVGAFLRFYELGDVPPGLHYDFAANAILASDIAFGDFREVFIAAYTGKETLFFYTAALLFKAVGSSVFSLQLTAAIYGVLGLAACFFASRELTRGWPGSPWLAAFATGILAFTFMHLVWSRYGERATTEPFVQGLAVGFLFRGLRRLGGSGTETSGGNLQPPGQPGRALAGIARLKNNPAVDLALAGAFTGLAAYTYLAARLFPIPIAFALGLHLRVVANRQPAGQVFGRRMAVTLGCYAVFLAAALLVFAPLGVYFLNNPEAFLVRANQLTPRPGESDLLWRGIAGALGMIFISGEPYDRFNIPERPIFGPVLGLFFLIGLASLLLGLFKIRIASAGSTRATNGPVSNPGSSVSPLAPTAALFLLAYIITFLIPTAVSVHDVFPSNVRSMGLMPLLPVLPALGVLTLVQAAGPRLASRLRGAAFALMLLLGALGTYHDYFNVWARAASLHYANDTDLVNAARWLNTQDPAGAAVYVSAVHYRHPTAAYLARDFGTFRWITGGNALAIPEGPALYVFPHSAPPPEDWIAAWQPLAAPPGPDGTPDFRAYRFEATAPLPGFVPFSANFGNIVEVTGYSIPAPGTLDVRLRVLNLPDQPDYRLVADLADRAGFIWAQAFNDAYFSEQWQVGETILMRLQYKTPVGMPPGEYISRLTVFSASAGTTLPALTPQGYAAAFAALPPAPFPGAGPQPLAQPLVTLSGVNLIALDPPPARLRPGEPVHFTLHWQLHAPLAEAVPLTTRLNHLNLETIAPAHNTYPFTQWQAGEIVIDRHAPRLPRDLSPGLYDLTVNDFLIGTVTVADIDREFSPPQPTRPLQAAYQSLIELVGYDLAPGSLTLYWRAAAESDLNYTRFVHVLDAGGHIVAQSDTHPVGGTYPTSLWRRGEYVRDEVRLPTGGAAIEVGWYVAETGERLKVGDADSVRITP